MKKQQFQLNNFNDLPVIDIIEVSSTLFFNGMLMFSAYMMSIHSYKHGFISLSVSCIYFLAHNLMKLKPLKAITWFVIFGFAIKGVMGL
jgi:hypothetical protein